MSSAENPRAIQRKVVVAACFGTFLEWYDFLTFASLATYFSVLFFPGDDPVAALLASLGTFGVGMIVRPLGAAFFGSLGDRHGRRTIFMATIILMGLSTFCVGLLPSYAQVGLLAPALLLLLRILQGFSVGGEIGGAAVYLTEHAPEGKRGLYTSVLQLMGPLGMMASTLQIVALQYALSDADFKSWGWRIPFLLSALLLAISIKSRLNLYESPVFKQLREKNALAKTPLRECFHDRHTLGRMALLFFCVSAGGSLLFFSAQVYTGVFLKTVVKLPATYASSLVTVATVALFPATLFCGWLSDRIGRRPVLLAGLIGGAVSIVPVFRGLLHYGSLPTPDTAMIVVLLLVLVVPLACITGPQTATLPELFPARTRYSAVALPHNLSAGWIGGMSPLMVTWLGVTFSDPLAGLWYPTGLLILASIIGVLFLPEVRNRSLQE
ncbi:MHS family MFS transporter [Rhodocyclus tenuis]|uniref:MHS family MFS transporter n=1 Tax=Rhodocyclus gracilis TaxID=2929842 RepID=A0ABX0WHK9_9RHOO|nr:MFS transporter [Rhodocyclus gracilis]NJA88351.1 MHS family MFS transporter [Rhodocyclus gracilis]